MVALPTVTVVDGAPTRLSTGAIHKMWTAGGSTPLHLEITGRCTSFTRRPSRHGHADTDLSLQVDTLQSMTDSGARSVSYELNGVEWDIPVDLLEIQRRFDEADADCARLAESDDQDAYRAAQQRRMIEVLALHEHPWLREHMDRGQRYQADTALKHLVRRAIG